MLALQNALKRKTYTGGTIKDSSVTEMFDVSRIPDVSTRKFRLHS